jgi:hypothetical protein
MKSGYLPLITFLFVSLSLPAQVFEALFVNDNAAFAPNTDTVFTTLQQSSAIEKLVFFDAVSEFRSPSFQEMLPYPLVIWYTSTDGVGLYFWDGIDADNPDLLLYIENGGMLWVMGNDFLFDRYGPAPVMFSTGDFPYDFLGIENYAAQSYGDDGQTGVAFMEYVDNTLVTGVPQQLNWIFPTLWWADACEAVEATTTPFYRMAPDTYILYPYFTAFAKHSPGENVAVSLTFDPALMISFNARLGLFEGILDFLKNKWLSVGIPFVAGAEQVQVFPNPFCAEITVKTSGQDLSRISFVDIQGRELLISDEFQYNSRANLSTAHLPKGLYIIKITTADQAVIEKKLLKNCE